MNILRSPEFKVGLLVLVVSALIGTMAMKVSEDPSYLRGKAKNYWFLVDDATGLVINSTVKMAGVNVGVIKDISLIDGLARIDISVQGDLLVTESAAVEVRALGLLGDKHIEINLGKRGDKPLTDGGRIYSAVDKGSLQAIMNEVGSISKSLADVAEGIKNAAEKGDETTSIGRIVRNIEILTGDLREVVGGNKQKINSIVSQVDSITRSMDEFISDEGDEGFKAAWKKVTKSLGKLDTTIQNVEEITGKINRGEGTIGRLVNDETTIEEVNTAVSGINELFDSAKKLETSFDVRSEYMSQPEESKTYIGVRLQPGLDRYYELAVIDDPQGVARTTDTSVTQGGTTTDSTTVTTFKNKTRFTALFAKNFYDFTLKGGLIESEGGLGVDYTMLNKKLRLSVEAFDFEDMNVRAFARYNLWKGLYLVGGGDDLADSGNDSAFFGAGLFLTNDDLKFFLARTPL